MSRWTVQRWRQWWLDDFVRTPRGRAGRARVMPAWMSISASFTAWTFDDFVRLNG